MGRVAVRISKADLLRAMKGRLVDLEELKLLNPNDLEIIEERRALRRKIAKLEQET